jgi:serine/threonine protein kinase
MIVVGVVRRGIIDNTEVAVKVFFPHADEALFEKELRNWISIEHPNIVRVQSACLEEGNLAMVMELMRCGSLYDYLHSDVCTHALVRVLISYQSDN